MNNWCGGKVGASGIDLLWEAWFYRSPLIGLETIRGLERKAILTEYHVLLLALPNQYRNLN